MLQPIRNDEKRASPTLETMEADDETKVGADLEAPTERKLIKAEQAKLLRQTVDTVGKTGQPGEKIQKVISVGMLSEGRYAKTVSTLWACAVKSQEPKQMRTKFQPAPIPIESECPPAWFHKTRPIQARR